MRMEFPWYVITGDINLDNFVNFWTKDRGFIWRGYTHENQMLPAAAKYDECNKEIEDINNRTNTCYPKAEIQRVAEKIYELNKFQKFPFEIPLLIRTVLFAGFYQPEDKLFKELQIKEFPDSSLAQAMAIVQHEFQGTTLLDFTFNKFKALYFAIGDEKNLSEDSHLFGLSVQCFETQKNNLNDKDTKSKDCIVFDLVYPSYFMNNKIAHQEGVFLYQKFKVDDGYLIGDKKYENIITFFKDRLNDKNNPKDNPIYKEISLDDFLKLTDKKEKPIFYVLLNVPAKEKKALKAFLDTIGFTKEYMMGCMNIA